MEKHCKYLDTIFPHFISRNTQREMMENWINIHTKERMGWFSHVFTFFSHLWNNTKLPFKTFSTVNRPGDDDSNAMSVVLRVLAKFTVIAPHSPLFSLNDSLSSHAKQRHTRVGRVFSEGDRERICEKWNWEQNCLPSTLQPFKDVAVR